MFLKLLFTFVFVAPGPSRAFGDRNRLDDRYTTTQLATALAGSNLEWIDLHARLEINQLGPGAYQAGNQRSVEAATIVTLGRLFLEFQGASLLLISRVGNDDVPAFDGVVVDERSKVILANFTLKSFVSAARHAPKLNAALDVTDAYARSAAWVDGLTGRGPSNGGQWDTKPTYVKVRPDKLAAYQIMRRIFVTDPPRPTWVLLDYDIDLHPTRNFDARNLNYSAKRPRMTFVVHQRGHLSVFCGGELKVRRSP